MPPITKSPAAGAVGGGRKGKGKKPQKTAKKDVVVVPPTAGTPAPCKYCGMEYASKTKLFQHLRAPNNDCNIKALEGGMEAKEELEKVVLYIGYFGETPYTPGLGSEAGGDARPWYLGPLIKAIDSARGVGEGSDGAGAARGRQRYEDDDKFLACVSQCSASVQRISKVYSQEREVGACLDALGLTTEKLCYSGDLDEAKESAAQFTGAVNAALASGAGDQGQLVVYCRAAMPNRFHAEVACNRRRYEYLVPIPLLLKLYERAAARGPWEGEGEEEEGGEGGGEGNKKKPRRREPRDWPPESFINGEEGGGEEPRGEDNPNPALLPAFRRLKAVLRRFNGLSMRVHNFSDGAVPHNHAVERTVYRAIHYGFVSVGGGAEAEAAASASEAASHNRPRGESWGAATPALEAEASGASSGASSGTRPPRLYCILSFSGDEVLRLQVRKMAALALAVMGGYLPMSWVDLALGRGGGDVMLEVPTAPVHPMRLAEVGFYRELQEDAMRGLREADTKAAIAAHRARLDGLIDRLETEGREDAGARGRLERWVEEELEPAIPRMLQQREDALELLRREAVLERGRQEAAGEGGESAGAEGGGGAALLPGLSALSALPAPPAQHEAAYMRVLAALREADRSGKWPATTIGRAGVIAEGTLREKGGEGGSFSVGSMPPPHSVPLTNAVFPELMEAAFELERVLLPGRQSSSTIAVNRHAQFLPHKDSGAGAGQGVSLIVALGDFVGGELMVEGVKHDIRYSPVEFNGWTQRHWTLPFQGERYSLVWFTPLGCEDMRGAELCMRAREGAEGGGGGP